MLESVAVVEETADVTGSRLVLIAASHDGGIIDDGRLEAARRGADDGIGTVAVIPGLCETARVDQVDAVFFCDQRFVSVTEQNRPAVFFHRLVIQVVQTIVDVLHMSVGQQDPSIVALDNLEIVCAVAAIAVAFDRNDRNTEFTLQRPPVFKVIACMGDEIQIGQFRENFPYFVQLSVGVPDY